MCEGNLLERPSLKAGRGKLAKEKKRTCVPCVACKLFIMRKIQQVQHCPHNKIAQETMLQTPAVIQNASFGIPNFPPLFYKGSDKYVVLIQSWFIICDGCQGWENGESRRKIDREGQSKSQKGVH